MAARSYLFLVHTALFALSVAVFGTGVFFGDFATMVAGLLFVFMADVLYACLKFRDSVVYFMLLLGIFLFLLTRPFVGILDPSRDWILVTNESTFFVLLSIYLSLFFLQLGVHLFQLVQHGDIESGLLIKDCGLRKGEKKARLWVFDSKWNGYFRTAALILFVVAFFGDLLLGFQRLSYMSGRAYEQYYLASLSDYSSGIFGDAELMMPFFLCAYLATMPKKTPSTIVLLMHVVTTLPLLIIGARTDFVMAILLMCVYYAIRSCLDSDEVWIGRKEILLVCVGLPLGILAMGALNYIRQSRSVAGDGLLWLLGDALYKQGATYKVLGFSYDYYPQISELGFRGYTFNPLTYNITQGFIGQRFLGMPLLPDVNSVELALGSNSYGNTLSYFAHPNYLGGEGWGSCYLAELYTDFGYVGIIVFSLLFGALSVLLSRCIGKNWFAGMVGLLAAYNVFHIARGTVLEWIAFVFKTRFWLAVVVIALLAFLVELICRKMSLKALVLSSYELPSGLGRLVIPSSNNLASRHHRNEDHVSPQVACNCFGVSVVCPTDRKES